MGFNVMLAILIATLLGFAGVTAGVIDDNSSSNTSWAFPIDAKTTEAVMLGVLLAVLAFLIDKLQKFILSIDFRAAFTPRSAVDLCRVVSRWLASSGPMRILRQEGVNGLLLYPRRAAVSAYKRTWPYQMWQSLSEDGRAAMPYLVLLGVLITYFGMDERIAPFTKGVIAGFESEDAVYYGRCYNTEHTDIWRISFCEGVAEGQLLHSVWDRLMERILRFAIYTSKISAVFALATFFGGWIGYRWNVGLGLAGVPTWPPDAKAMEPAKEYQDASNISSDQTDRNEDDNLSSSDNNGQPLVRQRKLCESLGKVPSTRSSGSGHLGHFEPQLLVKRAGRARKAAATDKGRNDCSECRQRSESLQHSRSMVARLENRALYAEIRYRSLRRLVEAVSPRLPEGLLHEFDELKCGQEEATSLSISAVTLVQYRTSVDEKLPGILERAVAEVEALRHQDHERDKEAQELVSIRKERSSLLWLYDEEKRDREKLEEWEKAAKALAEDLERQKEELCTLYEKCRHDMAEMERSLKAKEAENEEMLYLLGDRRDEIIFMANGGRLNREICTRQGCRDEDGIQKSETINGQEAEAKEIPDLGAQQEPASPTSHREPAPPPEPEAANGNAMMPEKAPTDVDMPEIGQANCGQLNADTEVVEMIPMTIDTEKLKRKLEEAATREAAHASELAAYMEKMAQYVSKVKFRTRKAEEKVRRLIKQKTEWANREVKYLHQIEALRRKCQESEEKIQKIRPRFDDHDRQRALAQIAERDAIISDLRARLESSLRATANDQAEKFRHQVQALLEAEKKWTEEKIQLTKRITAAKEEAQKASMALKAQPSSSSKVASLASNNPLQARFNELRRQLNEKCNELKETSSKLTEMTKLRDEAVEALAPSKSETESKKRSRDPDDEGEGAAAPKRQMVATADPAVEKDQESGATTQN
ncbi:hypothetical protein VTO42DRAFT_291 [Malbranchea cinnamomea]